MQTRSSNSSLSFYLLYHILLLISTLDEIYKELFNNN